MLRTSPRRILSGLVPLLFCLPLTAGAEGAAPADGVSCEAELACNVGERRSYDYAAIFVGEADVDTTAESGFSSATLSGASQVAVTAVDDKNALCTYEVSLTDVEVAEIVRGEEVESARGEELAELVGGTYYFTQAADGRITEMILDRELTPEAATFQRGVVNALNFTLREGEQYEVLESDMTGTHLADYRITRSSEQILVERERRAAQELLKSDGISADFETTQSASVTIDRGSCAVSQVNIDETVVIDAPDSSDPPVSEHFHHETITVRAAANMTLTSSGITKAVRAPSAAELERRGMVRLPVNAAVSRSADAFDNGAVIHRLLTELETTPTDRQLVRELSRQVRSGADGVGHLRDFIIAEAPTGKLARTLGSLLISLGAPQAQDVLVDHFLQDRLAEKTRERIVGLSTLIETPTPRLVRAVSRIADDFSAADRPTATLALGAYADSLRASHQRLAAELDQRLIGQLRRAGTADDTVLALRALGNAGSPDALEMITGYFHSTDMLTRLSAAIAVRKIDSPEVDTRLLELFTGEESRSVRQAIQRVTQERIEKGLAEETPALKTVIVNWSWSDTFGGNVANATFSASALVEDEPYLIDIQAGAEGEVFNNGFDILDLQLLTEEVNAQDRRFRFFIELAGNEIANIDDTETCSIDAEDTLWDESIELANLSSPPIPIIGPLTLSFNLDLEVEFYVNFFRQGDWCSANGELDMGFTPGVTLEADGYATLSLLIVRGGVGIAGTLVGIEFPIYAEAAMDFQDASNVCFVIDAQLLVADMELYAWGQYWTFWNGWEPDPKPQWTLWSFNLTPDAWNLVTECSTSLNCLPDVLWWDGSTIDAWFDGANCFVTTPPAGSDPFIANNAYYLERDTNCPAGMPWNGTGCVESYAPVFPGVGAVLGSTSTHAVLIYYRTGLFFPMPPCPAGWTTTQYSWNSRTCQRLPPAGYSPNDFFLGSQFPLLYTIYIDGSASCPAGNDDGTGCWLGNAPGGTNAFLWSGNFYYAEP